MTAVEEDRLKRHDLTDAEWVRLEPLLPGHPRRGRRWSDHRLVIDGVFFRTRTGCPWRGPPGGVGGLETGCKPGPPGAGDRAAGGVLDQPRAGGGEGPRPGG